MSANVAAATQAEEAARRSPAGKRVARNGNQPLRMYKNG
ncbi:hypothetical protein ACVWXS_000992 [Lysinibacillus sp. TE18511]